MTRLERKKLSITAERVLQSYGLADSSKAWELHTPQWLIRPQLLVISFSTRLHRSQVSGRPKGAVFAHDFSHMADVVNAHILFIPKGLACGKIKKRQK